MPSKRYDLRGVSADKTEVKQAISHLDKGLFPNAFCKVLPDILGNDPAYCNVMHADTAGTKTSLAYIYWRETGDLSVWAGIAQDALVMNLDDMACVGITDDILISSTIGRNKHHIPGEVLKAIIEGTMGFIERMKQFGVTLHHSGGETADVGDIVRTIDVGFTTIGRIKREKLIVNNIQDGNVIVGLSSYGQAKYEEEYNGGMGSNGLTSARHDVFSREYAEKYPESFEAAIPKELIYSGNLKLQDTTDTELNAGKLVLSPTRTYLPILAKMFTEGMVPSLNGIIHNSGGAQTKVLGFVENLKIIKDNLFKCPPLFKMIQNESQSNWQEMYKVFNMGHRLEIYCDASIAQEIISISESFGVDAQIVGRCESANEKMVEVKSETGTYTYR